VATNAELVPEPPPRQAFDWLLVTILSSTAGAADVIGFLALGGLFIAHVTGNIVVLTVRCVTGGSSPVGPLIAVPVFITVLATVIWASEGKPKRQTLRVLLLLHAALLAGFFIAAAALGPFKNPGTAASVWVGMMGVAAMATQNALVRLDLQGFPPTSALTGNMVQFTIDLTTLAQGQAPPRETAIARSRIRMTSAAFGGFVAGCAIGGILEVHFGLEALMLPVVLSVTAIPLSDRTRQPCPVTKDTLEGLRDIGQAASGERVCRRSDSL
jgi:uncharacterized membrane protein YoaK (UPF0700 family)